MRPRATCPGERELALLSRAAAVTGIDPAHALARNGHGQFMRDPRRVYERRVLWRAMHRDATKPGYPTIAAACGMMGSHTSVHTAVIGPEPVEPVTRVTQPTQPDPPPLEDEYPPYPFPRDRHPAFQQPDSARKKQARINWLRAWAEDKGLTSGVHIGPVNSQNGSGSSRDGEDDDAPAR